MQNNVDKTVNGLERIRGRDSPINGTANPPSISNVDVT